MPSNNELFSQSLKQNSSAPVRVIRKNATRVTASATETALHGVLLQEQYKTHTHTHAHPESKIHVKVQTLHPHH